MVESALSLRLGTVFCGSFPWVITKSETIAFLYGPSLYSRWEGCGFRDTGGLMYARVCTLFSSIRDLSVQSHSYRKAKHSPQSFSQLSPAKNIFPTLPRKARQPGDPCFVPLITSSDSALWAVWTAYPYPSQDHSLFCCIVRKLWLGI